MSTTKAWVRLPLAALQDEKLTKSDVTLLALMIDILDGGEPVIISVSELMSLSGYSRATVLRATQHLVECGYIATERTGRASLYKLTEEILPPKRRAQKESKSTKSTSKEEDFEKKYSVFLNRFEEEKKEKDKKAEEFFNKTIEKFAEACK